MIGTLITWLIIFCVMGITAIFYQLAIRRKQNELEIKFGEILHLLKSNEVNRKQDNVVTAGIVNLKSDSVTPGMLTTPQPERVRAEVPDATNK